MEREHDLYQPEEELTNEVIASYLLAWLDVILELPKNQQMLREIQQRIYEADTERNSLQSANIVYNSKQNFNK